MPVVWIPSLMRDLTGGESRVTVPGTTVRQVINNLEEMYPGIRQRICYGDDIDPTIAIAVDGELSELGMLQPVREQSEIHFLPAVSGGAEPPDDGVRVLLPDSCYHLPEALAVEWTEGALLFQVSYESDGTAKKVRWSSSPQRSWFRDAFRGGALQRKRASDALQTLQTTGSLPHGFRLVFPFRRRGEQLGRLN